MITQKDLDGLGGAEALIGRDIEIEESGVPAYRGPIQSVELANGQLGIELAWGAARLGEEAWTVMSLEEPIRVSVADSWGSIWKRTDNTIRVSAPMVFSAVIYPSDSPHLELSRTQGTVSLV